MLRLAKAGNRVLYVQPTGTRTMRVSDWRRIWERVRGKVAGVQRSSALPPELTIYSPLVLPFPYSRVARSINRWILFRKITGWLGKRIDLDVIFWFYFPSPLNADVMRRAKESLTIYQIMSSAEAVRPHPAFIEANDAMLKGCDLVLANSGRLRVQASRHNSSAYLFRAGVSLELFEAARRSEKPDDLQGINGPIIGYVGALHEWVDLELIRAVAASLPDFQFVLVGPIVRDVEVLRGLPNVRFLGQKPHGEVPRYVQYFDVCIIPYVRDAYTETTYPAKLNEYLALGKPVVATPLPELVDYNQEFDGVLRLAGDAPTFALALREAVEGNAPERQAHYRCVAGKNAWTTIMETMSGLIEEKLRTRRNAGKHA
ncbi:MAG: glycosyltransferase [Nitrospira sp.]|nr:glycosyltransferase [Nitrospira sp.]